jgi:histidinol-phosphate aminotransferase
MKPRDFLPAITIDREHGGAAASGTIDFSTSINPLGPPSAAIAEYHRAIDSLQRYPDPFADDLAGKIAQWIGVDADQVLVGSGSTQLIYLLARAMKWRQPVVVTPTFSEIANALILNAHSADRSTPRAVKLDAERDFHLRADDLTPALASGTDAIFIGRPNSPTGSMLSFDDAAAIARECEHANAHCVFDEAFIDFVNDARSMIHLIGRTSNVIVLRSLTKIFAIPGLRLGFAVAQPRTISWLRDMLEPWSVNAIAARVGAACLDGASEFVARSRSFVTGERDRVTHVLAQNPHLRVLPSAANFLMIAARETGTDSFGLFMKRQGIVVRDLRSLPGGGPGLYRVGIRNHEDNERLLAAARNY